MGELAALRRDAATFARFVLSLSTYRAVADAGNDTWSNAEYRYFTRLFVEICGYSIGVTYKRRGTFHRIDGPAIQSSNGNTEWYLNGMRHRTDGPAFESPATGFKSWWLYDQRHRTDGPAIERGDGGKEWWVHGVQQYRMQ